MSPAALLLVAFAAGAQPAPAPPAAPVVVVPTVSASLLSQAAETIFVREARKANLAKAYNVNRGTVSRARHGADPLIAIAAEYLPAAADWTWTLGVETRENPVAYVLPGGKIMVSTGFFERMRLTDAEYSALLAHTLAHALLGRDTAAAVAEYDRRRGSTAPDPDTNRAAIELGEVLGKVVLSEHYDPAAEAEADTLALQLLAKAGIDPAASIEAWGKVMRAGGATVPGFLVLHPVRQDRISAMEAQLPAAIKAYQQTLASQPPAQGSVPRPRR